MITDLSIIFFLIFELNNNFLKTSRNKLFLRPLVTDKQCEISRYAFKTTQIFNKVLVQKISQYGQFSIGELKYNNTIAYLAFQLN